MYVQYMHMFNLQIFLIYRDAREGARARSHTHIYIYIYMYEA